MIRRFPLRSTNGSSWVHAPLLGARARPALPPHLIENANRVLSRGLINPDPTQRGLQVLRGGLDGLRRDRT